MKIDKSEQKGTQNVTANVLNSVWKYDQIINGWDADSNDSRLMTIVEYGMGAYMSDTVADWAKEQFGKLPGPKPFAGHAPSKKDLGPRGPQMDTHDKSISSICFLTSLKYFLYCIFRSNKSST